MISNMVIQRGVLLIDLGGEDVQTMEEEISLIHPDPVIDDLSDNPDGKKTVSTQVDKNFPDSARLQITSAEFLLVFIISLISSL